MTRDDWILREVRQRLEALEAREDVKVLYACESGSRAWGFASIDSDFDVRFLYVRRHSAYLTIDSEHRPNVIELPKDDVWDITGWDLRKALRLFRKSNPPLLEWLHSPIVYCNAWATRERLMELLPRYYSADRALYHYLHMATRNHRTYLRGDAVRTKKYFYVLRPLLACRWIEADRGLVPVQFERLLALDPLDPSLRKRITELLRMKRSGAELAWGARIPEIHQFLETELQRLEHEVAGVPIVQGPVEPLNELFLRLLEDAWTESSGP